MSQAPPPPPPPSPSMPQPFPVPPAPRKKQYSIFTAIFLAPFSPSLWRDVGQNWRGIGLLYLMLLLTLTWLLAGIKVQRGFTTFIDKESPAIVNQVPKITITKGVVSTDVKQPYSITFPKTGETIALIDTTGRTTELPQGVALLLTKDSLIARQSKNELRTYDLSQVQSFQMDRASLRTWLGLAKTWIFPAVFVFGVIGSLIGRLIVMLVLAALGLGIASMMNVRLSYAALLRLSAIAMTPGIWLGTLEWLVPVPMGGCVPMLLGLALWITYLVLTIRANRVETPPPSMPGPYVPPMQGI